MPNAPLITLTTDFGTADGYVGAMKGVLSARAPSIPLVDIAHDIPPWDRTAAVLALRNAAGRFPEGAVHLLVVDPGVGSKRRGLVALGRGQVHVGADNGILSAVLPADTRWFAIRAEQFEGASPTFHGRDVFAPVAAHLATGRPLDAVAESISDPVRIALPMAGRIGNLIKGEVIHVDRFGNLITNINRRIVDKPERVAVSVNFRPVRLGTTFADAAPGEPIAYWGSGDLLEIGIREGDARARFGDRGLPVEVVPFG